MIPTHHLYQLVDAIKRAHDDRGVEILRDLVCLAQRSPRGEAKVVAEQP